MNANSGKSSLSELEHLAYAFNSMYHIVFHPFSFQKYIDTLPQSEQRRHFKFLFIPIGLISFFVIAAGNSIANYFGEFSNPSLTQALQAAIVLCCGFFGVLKPAVRKGRFVFNALAFLSITLFIPLLMSYFLNIFINNLYSRPFTDGMAIPIYTGLVGAIVFGLLGNAAYPEKASKRTTSNVMLYLSLYAFFQVYLIVGFGSRNIGSTLMLLLFSIGSFIVGLRPVAWLQTALSIRKANRQSLEQPERTIEFLKASRISKDEFGVLPYPGLEATLRRAALYDWHSTRDYLAWLIDERPYQASLARCVLTETIAADLGTRKNILDIAGAQERLSFMLPDPKILQDYVLESALVSLGKAAGLASKYCQQFGVVYNSVELEYIISMLDAEASALYGKKRSRSHKAVYDVIKVWQRAIHGENARSKNRVWQSP